MKKRVLVIYYSQTGQLEKVLTTMFAPLFQSDEVEIELGRLESTEDFRFPWPFWRFFDAFPETVYLDVPENSPLNVTDPESYDLIILGYQPWFLSPSMPMSAFLLSNEAKRILKGKPVMTVIGCRNMWIEAQKTMMNLIDQCGGRLIDNVVLKDQSGPMESFITTPRWMLSGKKDPFMGLSSAGISEEDIQKSQRFGQRILERFHENHFDGHSPLLNALGAVIVDERFIASEKIAKRSFRIWGGLIRLFGRRGSWQRLPVLGIYILFLVTLILTVVPFNMMIQRLLRRLFKGKIDKIVKTLEAPSGR